MKNVGRVTSGVTVTAARSPWYFRWGSEVATGGLMTGDGGTNDESHQIGGT